MGVYVLLQPPSKRLQEGVDLVDLGLKLQPEANAASRLLSFQIDTCPVVTGTPRACGLSAVTLDLASFAQLTSILKWSASATTRG